MNHYNLNPYIGITGFRYRHEVERMYEVFSGYRPVGSPRMLHVGTMMSRKTLLGKESRFTHAFPKNHEYREIFSLDAVYNCLHYVDYSDTPDPNLSHNLQSAICLCGRNLDAIQLDVVWPDPHAIQHAISSHRRKLEVILQVGPKAIDAAGNTPIRVVRKLNEYAKCVDRVLFDLSCGTGTLIRPNVAIPYLREIDSHHPFSLVVAGGFGPHTMEPLAEIRKQFPCVSHDAESRLRTSGSNRDPINWDLAADYIRKSF